MPTVARILQLAPVACYLASNRTAKGSLFGPPVDPRLPIAIFMVHKILKKIYDQDPTYTGVRVVADYLYELIQKYAFKAAAIVDNSLGGQVASQTSTVVVQPYDFEVGADTLIATGETSVTIERFRGLNVNFRRGGVSQNTTSLNDGSSYYAWNSVTALFTISPAATEGELFRIEPDNIGGSSSVNVVGDTVFPFIVTSADFEADGVTLNDARLVGETYYLFVTGYNQDPQFEGSFFDYTATGLVVTASGFDAANYGNIIIQKIN